MKPIDRATSVKVENVSKPCHILKYCPYGPLVERFPLLRIKNVKSCNIFGHQCPVFSVAENFIDGAT